MCPFHFSCHSGDHRLILNQTVPDCFFPALWEHLHQINTSICTVKSNWKLLPICGCTDTQADPLAGWLQSQSVLMAKPDKSNLLSASWWEIKQIPLLMWNILAVFNCVHQLKPSQLLRFHSSSEKYSCSNPLINVCLGDVSMETVFTATQCSKNGSKVITVPDWWKQCKDVTDIDNDWHCNKWNWNLFQPLHMFFIQFSSMLNKFKKYYVSREMLNLKYLYFPHIFSVCVFFSLPTALHRSYWLNMLNWWKNWNWPCGSLFSVGSLNGIIIIELNRLINVIIFLLIVLLLVA